MKEATEILENFPENIENTLSIKKEIKIKSYKNIVISGMGGSAIPGDIIKDLLLNKSSVPIFVSREYLLPKFANEKTLLFVLSYSGNTEETISSLKDGIAKKCKIIAITSNGEIEEICKLNNIDYIKIPTAFQPRFALQFLFFPILILLKNDIEEIKDCIRFLREERENIKKLAKEISLKLKNKIPLIYSYFPYNCVAKRLRTQFNENAKVFSFVNEFPECCHNDILAWENKNSKNFVVIILRDKEEDKKMKKRVNATKKLALKNSYKIIEIYAKGKTNLAKIFYLIYIGDFISVYLANLYNKNPMDIEIIEKLKKELS